MTQQFAVSADGTKVPYFMVAKKGLVLDSSMPTLLYGYGGFEISLGPGYATTIGIGWLERGGKYSWWRGVRPNMASIGIEGQLE